MNQQIVASITVHKMTLLEVTYQRPLKIPVDPQVGMHLLLACKNTEDKIFKEIRFEVTQILYDEKNEKLLCWVKQFQGIEREIAPFLADSANWEAV